jgi:hypothetical protein
MGSRKGTVVHLIMQAANARRPTEAPARSGLLCDPRAKRPSAAHKAALIGRS